MSQGPEHAPGEVAPISGTYEQINVFGRSTGIHTEVAHGHQLPRAPQGHSWRLVREAGDDLAPPL